MKGLKSYIIIKDLISIIKKISVQYLQAAAKENIFLRLLLREKYYISGI
jgi:hypothetical protein